MEFVEPIVEIKGEKYVLWHHIDAYKVNESLFATPLKDWRKLQKKYGDDMETYQEFGIIGIVSYDGLKESIQEMLDEEME